MGQNTLQDSTRNVNSKRARNFEETMIQDRISTPRPNKSVPTGEDDDIFFEPSDRNRGNLSFVDYPLKIVTYKAEGTGSFDDRATLCIWLPIVCKSETIKSVLINNDNAETGPTVTVVYFQPPAMLDADILLHAERTKTNPMQSFHPQYLALKQAVLDEKASVIACGEQHSLGKLIVKLPFKANRSSSEIVVKSNPEAPNVLMITLKKLDESEHVDIAALI